MQVHNVYIGVISAEFNIEHSIKMGSIVLKSLSILLGVFFVFVGITKLTPFISKELHKDLVS